MLHNTTLPPLAQKNGKQGHSNGHTNGHSHEPAPQREFTNGKAISQAVLPAEYNQETIEAAVESILQSIGEDPQREGLLKTPNRVARMYSELTSGYFVDTEELINGALFSTDYDEIVVVKDIDFHSLCEHHMLPFYGRAHIAYIPNGKVVGLSKIPRIVEMFARRLQIQEQMTSQIANFINDTLNPRGVAVIVEGAHMCAVMRGVKKANTRMTTSTMLGEFRENAQLRNEFIAHINQHTTEI